MSLFLWSQFVTFVLFSNTDPDRRDLPRPTSRQKRHDRNVTTQIGADISSSFHGTPHPPRAQRSVCRLMMYHSKIFDNYRLIKRLTFFFFQILLEIRAKKSSSSMHFRLCTRFCPSAKRRLGVNLAPSV